ncbi:hypothetical protein B1F83_02825 [Chlamydia gallinacea]|nr:hypothetical protein B1F83_02825 [Chlamydia gallinacea]
MLSLLERSPRRIRLPVRLAAVAVVCVVPELVVVTECSFVKITLSVEDEDPDCETTDSAVELTFSAVLAAAPEPTDVIL